MSARSRRTFRQRATYGVLIVVASLVLVVVEGVSGVGRRVIDGAMRMVGTLGFTTTATARDPSPIGPLRAPIGMGTDSAYAATQTLADVAAIRRRFGIPAPDSTVPMDSVTAVAAQWEDWFGEVTTYPASSAAGRLRVAVYDPAHRREAIADVDSVQGVDFEDCTDRIRDVGADRPRAVLVRCAERQHLVGPRQRARPRDT